MSDGGGAGMAGNAILGGGIGALINANNSATQKLVSSPLVFELEPKSLAGAPQVTQT